MWFDEPVVILGTLGFVYRYFRARLLGLRVAHARTPLANSPEVTWFITTRDLPGPLLHTLATGIASTRYPNLQIVILDCGHSHPAKQIVERLGDPRISIVTSQRTQPEWYMWICSQPGTEFFVVTHDDLHFVADGWLEDIVQPMILDQTIGCVCGEEFPVRLNTIEPGGECVDITFGLSTWMWAARRTAVANHTCDFSFSKRERGITGNLEVWDQGGLWLERLKRDGWRIATESTRDAIKWQHFENFDWTREFGDENYGRMKRNQRKIITVLAQLQFIAYKLRNRA